MEKNRILEGNLYKAIMAFFLPIWFGTFFQQLYNTVDAVIVGNFVGKAALAAVGGPTSTIINLLVGFFVGLSSGAGVVISLYFGSRDIEKTDTAIHTAIAVAMTGGANLMVIGIPFSPIFLEWMGTPADVLPLATTYIRIYFIASIFNLIYNIGSGILRAMGDSKKPLYFLIFASIVNIVLDILFVVILRMGVAGVAWATILAQASSAVLVIITLHGLPDYIRFEFSKVRIRLHTGRTHQIRVQFASRDLPLVGERKYSLRNDPCEIALWSYRLAFAHPATGQMLEFTKEPPREYPWNFEM
jgi:Na+-driven multidrug efflux pump